MSKSEQKRELYEALVHDLAGQLYCFAYRLCGQVETAEDLVQETFTEAWRGIGALRDRKKGKAWLFQICRHRYAHWVRDSRRRIQAQVNIEDVHNVVSVPGRDPANDLYLQEMLQSALDALDDRYKESFLMVFLEGLTCRETAERLEIPLGTVLSRNYRARLFLRDFLRDFDQANRASGLPERAGWFG